MIIIRSSKLFSVRFTDFVSVPTYPSDKSLGYFQSSARRGLTGTDFLGKAPPLQVHFAKAATGPSGLMMSFKAE
jgi:hypothetical protein